MRFASFYLMPWLHTPQDLPEHESSAWVTYSNRNWDAGKGQELYERYLSELATAEEYGFDVIAVNEHHQTSYGMMPSPNLMAMALIQRTKDVRIAILGNAIPLRDHPLRVAEEVAMLDVMSGGRIICGIVRGLGAEYHSFSMNPVHSSERFMEAHDLLIAAWTRPGPFEWDGKHYKFRYVNPWPLPMQQPHPPIWVPTQGSATTVQWAARHRYPLFQTNSALETVRKSTGRYYDFAMEYGYEPHPHDMGLSVHVYVGRDDDSALHEFKPHVDYFHHVLRHRPKPAHTPPGYVPRAAVKEVLQRRSKDANMRSLTAEELLARGELVVGDAASVTRQLKDIIDQCGLGTLTVQLHTGSMGAEMTRASSERFAEHVMPKLKDYLPGPPVQATMKRPAERIDPVSPSVPVQAA